MTPTLRIVAVDITNRLALASDDRLCEITNLFDSDGEETDDPDEATSAVVRYDDGKWFSLSLLDYDVATQ